MIRVISTASLPCTGTGKNRSRSVAALALPATLIAAMVSAIRLLRHRGLVAGLLRFARADRKRDRCIGDSPCYLLDAGKGEAGDELALEDQEDRQQRRGDEEGAGGDHAPF